MTKNIIISAAKANRLFWLGRYTERVYLSLHLLRRCYDIMLDGEAEDYEMYLHRLTNATAYSDEKALRLGFMYDEQNPSSIRSGLESAMDNGIVLREDIASETLSYLELSLSHVKAEAAKDNSNITALQPVTDYLLAFWGSIDERILDVRTRNFLRVGKFVESIDIHVRFDYPWERVAEIWDSLKWRKSLEEGIFDPVILRHLDHLLASDANSSSPEEEEGRKGKVLKYINHLVLL